MQSNSGNGAVSAAADQTATGQAPAEDDTGGSATPADDGARVFDELRAIRDQLGVLTDREAERAAHRESVIDRLHSENQTLRRRELDVMLEPVRMGLYRLYDLARREADRWSGPGAPAAEHAGPLLEVIAEDVCEVLARTGVEPFTAEAGEPYDSARHRPVDTEDVTDKKLDKTVVRTVNNGFTRGDTVARRADVVVGQLRPRKRTRKSTRDT